MRTAAQHWKRRFSPRIGDIGETLALRYLLSNGFDVISRNFHIGNGELDIIAFHKDRLVFVEVKTRSRADGFPPQMAVTARKEEQIVRLANAFCHRYGLEEMPLRFDVVAVIMGEGSSHQIEHFAGAF
jgi:putative endonuclease